MAKYITEILTEINEDPKSIEKYKANAALRFIFEHAFLVEKKFDLPEGDPPYKKDSAPLGMTPANLYQEVRKLYVFCRKDLKALRKETLFVQLLENLHPSEAELVLAIKDQKLTKKYPKITQLLMLDSFLLHLQRLQQKTPRLQKRLEPNLQKTLDLQRKV